MKIQQTSSSTRLHGLDHLRAIAILLVMIFHYGSSIPAFLEPIRTIGWTGVDLFFVLSGYLIGYQLLKEYQREQQINFKQFYIKRFFRIIPAYISVLILYFSLGQFAEGNGLPNIFRFLSFTQNYGLDPQTQKSFSHAWSLCVEEQFYLILPIIIFIIFRSKLQRLSPYLFLSLIILGFLIRHYNWETFVQPHIDSGDRKQMVYGFLENIYYPTHNRMDGLIIGVMIAAIFTFKPEIKKVLTKNGNLMLVIGLLLFAIAYQICQSLISYQAMIFGLPLISLAYGILLIGVISPSCILHRVKSRFTYTIAILSYAIYLTHKQLYSLIKKGIDLIGIEELHIYTFWICMVIAIIGGLVLHLLIEKPFLRMRKHYTKL